MNIVVFLQNTMFFIQLTLEAIHAAKPFVTQAFPIDRPYHWIEDMLKTSDVWCGSVTFNCPFGGRHQFIFENHNMAHPILQCLITFDFLLSRILKKKPQKFCAMGWGHHLTTVSNVTKFCLVWLLRASGIKFGPTSYHQSFDIKSDNTTRAKVCHVHFRKRITLQL